MSQEKPELRAVAEASYQPLNSGDLDAYLAVCADDVEFTSLLAESEATTFHGHEGVRAWWNTVLGKFDEVHWELLGAARLWRPRVWRNFRDAGPQLGFYVANACVRQAVHGSGGGGGSEPELGGCRSAVRPWWASG